MCTLPLRATTNIDQRANTICLAQHKDGTASQAAGFMYQQMEQMAPDSINTIK